MKIFRFFFKIFYWLILLLLIIFFVIYAIAPIYTFPDYKPFYGDHIYNPYQNIESTAWRKGNFQVQSRAWWGITNGRNNSNRAIQTVYSQMGYDIIVTSDYMKINKFGNDLKSYIPTYEHGYGIRKVHQVCLGAESVCWMDYPFFQNKSHKQHMLNILKKKNKMVAIAHPKIRDGYTLEDMHYLSNYDLMEVLNQIRFSIDHWDAALSSGHPAFILANDDAHDVFNPYEVGRVCTFINSESFEADDVLDALKAGRAYGADIAMPEGSDFVQKAVDHKSIPHVISVEIINDSLFVRMSEKAQLFSFIGQNGVVKKTVYDTSMACYRVMPIDSYIRTEITFPNTTKLYLNPVIRHQGEGIHTQPPAEIDRVKTWIQRGIALVISILILWVVVKVMRNRKRKKRINKRYYHYGR